MSIDREQRIAAVENTDRSVVVEASAGTGKTSALVRRILHLVLRKGPEGAPISLKEICAITFTEKAAGELKIRLRKEFEECSSHPDVIGGRARQALAELEMASISTFHAFAVSLLKERPIEAGLDPHFEALDELHSELLFNDVWATWLNRAVLERTEELARALRAGLRLDSIQQLARVLYRHSGSVRSLRLPRPATEQEIERLLKEKAEEGSELRSLVLNSNDKLVPYLEAASCWIAHPHTHRSKLAKPGRAGAKAHWLEGKKTVERVRSFVLSVEALSESFSQLPLLRALDGLIRWIIDDFLAVWESEKRKRGLLEFEDQLRLARDLLVFSRDARAEFQNRYATLLVDEFQDTDPVQLDLVLLLSSLDIDAADPSLLRPAPGRLFIVGDPKQSIYRFRGADIETYQDIVDPERLKALGLERLELTMNFRSVPSILGFVDSAFGSVMMRSDDGNYQPGYLAFGEMGAHRKEMADGAVHLLGDAAEDLELAGSGREYLSLEASRIAKLINRMVDGEGWQVARSGGAGDTSLRPRYGDIAILIPVLTHAGVLEGALREADIPYVLEGGKFYYARSEVASAITVLRAISNPNDRVALYGALRSVFFGLSDGDILREHIKGRPLNYLESVPPDSRFLNPYSVLKDLHANRHHRVASETFESLLQQTGSREVLAVRGFQSLANLQKLARTLRSLQEERPFSEVVDLLHMMEEGRMAESESRLMEEQGNAVRIMSIHKAKGLDFPIVLVAGLGMPRRTRNADYVEDSRGTGTFALRVRCGDFSLDTPDWDALSQADRKREDAELLRLLYVAFTRARDHIVVSTHHRGKEQDGSGRWSANFKSTRLEPLSVFLMDCLKGGNPPAGIMDVGALDAVHPKSRQPENMPQREFGAILDREYRDLRRLLEKTPHSGDFSAPSHGSDEMGVDKPTELASGRALRFGLAFHEGMERADFGDDACVREHGRAVAMKYSLNHREARKLEEMMRSCLESPLLIRAGSAQAAGGRIVREMPYVRPLPSEGSTVLEEGKIALLFEEADGWILVDYKTDLLDPKSSDCRRYCHEKYAVQMGQYCSALSEMGVRVKSSFVLLARYGIEIQIGGQ